MNLSAIIMLLITVVIIFGGLAVSLVLMVKRPLTETNGVSDDHEYNPAHPKNN